MKPVLIQVPFIPFSYLIGCRGCNSRVPDPVIERGGYAS